MNTTFLSGTLLTLAFVAALPAAAVAAPTVIAPGASTVPSDIDDLDGDLAPDPKVVIDVAATCEPGAGIAYSITIQHEPENATGVEMQWMDEGGATGQSIGAEATVPSGEGVFDVRALLHTTTGFIASEWQDVVVDCAADLPLRGTPDFTG
ncbi:hypothetical protein [Microbacterium sp. NPDC077184]|uniref:hypothetical protein n=1 Tax=Microbacterium sp. NPDC077184 TaxID=3154764 RepID=UPI00343CD1C2